ncbi:hypothetical protein F5Y11DRAFT_367256 [Daldinia sp. FL1419]|nr:hypothetical protein F5Y11DRAFT_367256 [Daldinia sp. FL1419]
MEHHRLPRHSSSHGTLHSSYSHGRPPHGPSPIRPLHKPLRSVNENSVLLPSPGALESMLKTTTETGDIGIFSIKPIPPLPQRREDIAPRSYSMSNCGPRHLSHHRSTTTLQSQAIGGPLQRPRSPFPYPTRLKRPGVRPASPALTENGRVDYSRMVEIDRASYRTAHGPYKPSYPPTPQRPHPLGLRADANLSTVSLPSQGLPPLSRRGPLGPSSIRTHSTASMASYNGPYRERFDNSSSRTSSLTSLVNTYHKVPHTPRVGPSGLSASVPRYYDYTEGFESRQPRAITPVQPFAPIPTRISNFNRPLVLQDPDESLAAAFRERDSAFFEAGSHSPNRVSGLGALSDVNRHQYENFQATADRIPSRCNTGSVRSESRSITFGGSEADRKFERGNDIDLLPSQVGRDSMDTFNPSLDLESKDAPTYSYTDYRATATSRTKANSPEKQVLGGKAPTIRSEQGIILRDDTQGEIFNEDEICESDVVSITEKRDSQKLLRNSVIKRPCSEPTEELSKSVHHDTEYEIRNRLGTIARAYSDCSRTIIRDDGPEIATAHRFNGHGYKACDSAVSSADGGDCRNDVRGVVQRQQFQRHKRNQAIPRISTSSLPREDNEGFPYISPSCSTTPIVSPKPISPARQLKLKNSIPQLMKALPPLPGDPDYIPPPTPSIQSTSSTDTDVVEVLAPFNFSKPSIPHQPKDAAVGIPECDLRDNRLRLRVKASHSSETTIFPGTKLNNAEIDPNWAPRAPDTRFEGPDTDRIIRRGTRNKLKLRSSRIRRNVDGEVSDDLLTLPADLSPTPSSINGESLRPRWIEDSSTKAASGIDLPNKVVSQSEQLTSPTKMEVQNKPPYSSRSMDARVKSNARQPQGLRRRISDLHCFLVDPPGAISTMTDTTIEPDRKDNRSNQGATPRTFDSREPRSS